MYWKNVYLSLFLNQIWKVFDIKWKHQTVIDVKQTIGSGSGVRAHNIIGSIARKWSFGGSLGQTYIQWYIQYNVWENYYLFFIFLCKQCHWVVFNFKCTIVSKTFHKQTYPGI